MVALGVILGMLEEPLLSLSSANPTKVDIHNPQGRVEFSASAIETKTDMVIK